MTPTAEFRDKVRQVPEPPRWCYDDVGKAGLVCYVGADQRIAKRNGL